MTCESASPRLLHIRQEKHLARILDLDVARLRRLAESAESHCEQLWLHDPAKPGKDRLVLDLKGPLRHAQQRIYRCILLPRLEPSEYSYGGVRGRHIKLNATKHLRSQFAFTCDVSNFYPSIHFTRVYRYFVRSHGCSPDVARLLTQLCTYRHHLALGLITSPLLADQFLKPVDDRTATMARTHNLVYTRYVDDITLSGNFDLRRSGFPAVIKRILDTNGFSTNDAKDQFGRVGDADFLITKLRVNRGHLDVSLDYLDDLRCRLRELRTLAEGGEFSGPYYTHGQMWGRVEFVSWVNPGRRRQLRNLFNSVPWEKATDEAQKRNLVVSRRSLVPLRGSESDGRARAVG